VAGIRFYFKEKRTYTISFPQKYPLHHFIQLRVGNTLRDDGVGYGDYLQQWL
jgi:hypothetical protein